MIQILGLRQMIRKDSGKPQTFDAFFKNNWRAESVSSLFQNLSDHLGKIPDDEHWNLYYTAAICTDKKRDFKRQEIIPFDVDGCAVRDDESWFEPYIEAVCSGLGIKREETGIVFSGHGLQFIVGLAAPFDSVNFFNERREHYKALCGKIDASLAAAGLPGKADPSVFSPARILRLPGTENRKPDKPIRRASLLQARIIPVNFDLLERSGLPRVSVEEQIPLDQIKKFPKPDSDTVLSSCLFLQHCQDNAAQVDEPELYAALSIVGRLDNPQMRAVEMFRDRFGKRNHGGTEADLLEKLDQATNASGPRTCKGIGSLWNGCHACPHFDKVASPIVLKGPNHIATQDTGFHDVIMGEKGPRYKPNYEDLRRYFEQQHPYVTLGGSKRCFVWSRTHWTEMTDAYLENFAQVLFHPYANTTMTQEFKNLICRTNLRDADWFVNTTNGKMNFKNGVLDLTTLELSPHSPDYGFRYVLPYDYQPEATCPSFERFLLDIMGGDLILINVLMEFAGYSFSNDTCWASKCLIMTGVGSNGKSTFMNVLKALAGPDNYAPLTLAELKADTNRQMIDGRLFNLAEETPAYAVMESSLFKNLVTGGETTVRMLYKQPYAIRNKCKFLFACNELPQTKDTTRGFFRRLLIIPFNQDFETNGRKDPFIEDKLLQELPGIFNLVIEGYRRLKAQKAFSSSPVIDKQLQEYRLELDTVEHWIKDALTILPVETTPDGDPLPGTRAIPVQKLYAAYSLATEQRGLKPENSIVFGKRLMKHLPESRRKAKKIDGHFVRVVLGVSFEEQEGF